MSLIEISRWLAEEVDSLHFAPPTAHVYNPLRYAAAPHEAYLQRYGKQGAHTLLLGMNPGPFGMTQTGVPFGEVALVRDWLGIQGPVGQPPSVHPKRPIEGFACQRSEVSGARLWGWARERFGTPQAFFRHFFVVNFCPLIFLEEGGKNRTPEQLPAAEQAALFELCREALRRTVAELEPQRVIGVGAFAEKQARLALGEGPVAVGRILHPSPASPIANRGWAAAAEDQLKRAGVHWDS